MRKVLAFLFVLLLLAGCTQAPQESQEAGGVQEAESGLEEEEQGMPGLVSEPSLVDVSAQLSELGLPISGDSEDVRVSVKYDSLPEEGVDCELELEYELSDCSEGDSSRTGDTHIFCKPPYEYTLTSSCRPENAASVLQEDTKVDGKRFTTSVWIPWYESASSVSVLLSLDKGTSTVDYHYETGDYLSDYSLENSIIVDNPSQYITVEGGAAESVLSEIRGIIGSLEYDASGDFFDYIPNDWYGANIAPYICVNEYGVVKADPGVFEWENGRSHAENDPARRLVYPSGFVLGRVSSNVGGEQLNLIGLPFENLEDYQGHYRACKMYDCREAYERDNVFVLSKEGSPTASSSDPGIVSDFSRIKEMVLGINTVQGMDDFVCFALVDSFAAGGVLGDYATGNGLAYSRVFMIDRFLEVIITDSRDEPVSILEHLINDRLDSNDYSLSQVSSSMGCTLYEWGSPNDSNGYAGYCDEPTLKLLFFNICTRDEDCEPSAQAFFDRVSQV